MGPGRKPDNTVAAPNASLLDLFSRLSLAASSNDFENVLAISDDILKSSPADSNAAKQKLVALIKLDKYKDALSFLDKCTFLNSKETVLERGFCLYKLGQGNEAETVLREGSGRAVQHVRAQNVCSLSHRSLTAGISNGGFCDRNEDVCQSTTIERKPRS